MTATGTEADVQRTLEAAREAQRHWAETPIRQRLGMVRNLRHALAEECDALADTVNRSRADTLATEVLPLLDAYRFLENKSVEILRPRELWADDRPVWLTGVDAEIRREPFGLILVIGPGNYPLFLAGVHAVQALVAGNAVIVKPGAGGFRAMQFIRERALRAGLDGRLFALLSEDAEEAKIAIRTGVDKVIFTGSNATGTAVLQQLAACGTPAVMELSGHDPVFVRPGADVGFVVKALRFGLTLNEGNTCIAPKHVIAFPREASVLRERLAAEHLSIPVTEVSSDEHALSIGRESGYGLGASIFGDPKEARAFARRVHAGSVVINDIIAPTADPRLPFGGRSRSGFGVTRGAEGLLEMTTVKAISVRRNRFTPHFAPRHPVDSRLFASFIALSHAGSMMKRFRALGGLAQSLLRRR